MISFADRTGIDLNRGDNSGETPFMLADLNGHNDIVKVLFDHSDSKNIDVI